MYVGIILVNVSMRQFPLLRFRTPPKVSSLRLTYAKIYTRPFPKQTPANRSTGPLRYIQLPQAGNWRAVSCGQFQIGRYHICLQRLTDRAPMLLIDYTKPWKGALLVPRSMASCSKIKSIDFSSLSLNLEGSLYFRSKIASSILILSFLLRQDTGILTLPNILQANWQLLSTMAIHATYGLFLLSSHHSIPSCTNMECHDLDTGRLSPFRSLMAGSTQSASKGWQIPRSPSNPRFPSSMPFDQPQLLESGSFFLSFQKP